MDQSFTSFRLSDRDLAVISQGGERKVSKVVARYISEQIEHLTPDDFDTKTSQVTISVDEDTAQALKAKAAELDIPVSKLVRVIAEKAIAAEKAEKAQHQTP